MKNCEKTIQRKLFYCILQHNAHSYWLQVECNEIEVLLHFKYFAFLPMIC